MLLYVAPLLLFDCLYPRRALPVAPPTAASLLADVYSSLFFYDLFFAICHFAMHKVRVVHLNVCFFQWVPVIHCNVAR